METIDETGTTLWATDEARDGKSLEWVLAHAKPQAGWEPHRLPVALFDPIPPAESRPAWLLKELSEGDVLIVRRRELPRGECPVFDLLTPSGRDLGCLPRHIAEIVDGALAKGVQPEVSVFTSFWYYPPATALQLELDLLVWCPAGEFAPKAVSFRAGHA
jgi:hypothetical protein